MKPKYLKTFYLFLKSSPKLGIFKKFSPIKITFDNYKKIIKSLFLKMNSHFFNLLGQILFLAIILLFLFLLSIYFSQIKFIKKHSNLFNLSSLNFGHQKVDKTHFFLRDKINIYDFILSSTFSKGLCFCMLPRQFEIDSKIKIDYG